MKVKNTITISYSYVVDDPDTTYLPLGNDDNEEMEEFVEYVEGEDPVYWEMTKMFNTIKAKKHNKNVQWRYVSEKIETDKDEEMAYYEFEE